MQSSMFDQFPGERFQVGPGVTLVDPEKQVLGITAWTFWGERKVNVRALRELAARYWHVASLSVLAALWKQWLTYLPLHPGARCTLERTRNAPRHRIHHTDVCQHL